MKEQLISFNTAKLAKEKGFSSGSANHYENDGQIQYTRGYYSNSFIEDGEILFEAPTQSLLQKWLRDEHKISMEISGSGRTYFAIAGGKDVKNKEDYRFTSYELALEKGLATALKLIKYE
jgi:hypothetical protein